MKNLTKKIKNRVKRKVWTQFKNRIIQQGTYYFSEPAEFIIQDPIWNQLYPIKSVIFIQIKYGPR